MVKVIDSFLYNGEPIVPFRLQLLDSIVDKFIITECRFTHSGKQKPFLWCERNAAMFEAYRDKIQYVIIDEVPPMPEDWMNRSYSGFMKNANDWWRENYQRDVIREEVEKAMQGQQFILICTDADEIPNPSIFSERQHLYSQMTDVVYLQMLFFYYNFNWIKKEPWYHGYMVTDQTYCKDTLSNLRCYYPKRMVISDGGWHCGYFLSIQDLQRKIDSFAHQEWNQDLYKDPKHLRYCLENGKDLYLRDGEDMEFFDDKLRFRLPLGWEAIQAEILNIQRYGEEI